MSAQLSDTSAQSLTEQLSSQLAQRIHQGMLAPGAKLPSVREAAKRYNVSPFTVVAAYDRLQAQGLIEAQRGRGFFVRALLARPASVGLKKSANDSARAARPAKVDAGWLIRGMFAQLADHDQPGSGMLPASWLDNPHVGPAMREAARAAPERWLQYGQPQGLPELREQLALRLRELGIPATPEQIITTNGATHALDIVCRSLLHTGDAVLVESPGWFVEHARYSELGVNAFGVPRLADGPDLAVLETLVQRHSPKLFVCVAKMHNPTGSSLSATNAHRLMQLAARYGFMVVEDDTYADFAEASSSAGQAPRLTALDGLQHSIYVSSFSKSLAPGWRCGFIAAPEALVERLTDIKLLSTLTTQPVGEMALHYVLATGAYRRHMLRLVEHLQRARGRTVKLALQHGCEFLTPPSQGMFGWVDTGVDAEKLALALHEERWLIAPGALFYPERQSSTLMRINYATSQDARFWKAFDKARELIAARRAA
jgi:DNA-binding transcriptional MocR family regulator